MIRPKFYWPHVKIVGCFASMFAESTSYGNAFPSPPGKKIFFFSLLPSVWTPEVDQEISAQVFDQGQRFFVSRFNSELYVFIFLRPKVGLVLCLHRSLRVYSIPHKPMLFSVFKGYLLFPVPLRRRPPPQVVGLPSLLDPGNIVLPARSSDPLMTVVLNSPVHDSHRVSNAVRVTDQRLKTEEASPTPGRDFGTQKQAITVLHDFGPSIYSRSPHTKLLLQVILGSSRTKFEQF